MAGRAVEAVAVAGLATVVTAIIAFAVIRAPSVRVFGMPIVGWHQDPYTVMAQFVGAPRPPMYWQPFTDAPGGFIARFVGGIAAYNWIVLLSFPLAAGAAFLLARHLALSTAASTLAAMAFAFSPFHVAHAAYHPHIAQVEWIPFYLLALWRCLDRASIASIAWLVFATAAVTLSNFYGGLIAAVITPVAVVGYPLLRQRATGTSRRDLLLTVVTLVVIAGAGVAYVAWAAPALFANRAAFAFPKLDLVRYSAIGWSFFMPPVAHPWLGEASRRYWDSMGMRVGLLEQQVYLGWSLVALAATAIGAWITDRLGAAPLLVAIALTALFFATSPPVWLYDALPMFRSYARFGVVVQLMTALAAGIGFDVLWRSGSLRWRAFGVTLIVLLVAEYAVSPGAMSR